MDFIYTGNTTTNTKIRLRSCFVQHFNLNNNLNKIDQYIIIGVCYRLKKLGLFENIFNIYFFPAYFK